MPKSKIDIMHYLPIMPFSVTFVTLQLAMKKG
jgi:hypothetical protein